MMFQGLKTSRNYSLQYIKNLCNPKNVYICDGSKQEYDRMAAKLVRNGTFTKLSRPNSYLANSHPNDVTDMEDRTFICSSDIDDAGPTNNWYNPGEMKIKMESLFKGSMKGRTMYIIPFRLGPKGEFSINGLQITDSPYVVCNMHITTQVGANDKPPMLCMHSVGKPLKEKEHDVAWPCDVKNKYITHFIENKEVWSYGSGYGDNALLGGKCLALRLASVIAKKEGWLAENMSIFGLTNPKGKKIYIAVAFPNSCGKTNLSMLNSKLPGWKITTVGDNIAWMHVRNGNLYAVNPEVGFYSSAWGISEVSNPNAMEVCKENAIFTNTALTNENDVWWEGMTKIPPDDLIDWKGDKWNRKDFAAHRNSKFTAPASQCPTIDPEWQNPEGVLISAILFGGKRQDITPLVYESYNWNHGVLMGASLSSEVASATGCYKVDVRNNPFAMSQFCGYNMGDYFSHWISIGGQLKNRPKIFNVNWFMKDEMDFSENIHVLKWIHERTYSDNNAKETAIGYVPRELNLDILSDVDRELWKKEIAGLKLYFSRFQRFPEELTHELNSLEDRLL